MMTNTNDVIYPRRTDPTVSATAPCSGKGGGGGGGGAGGRGGGRRWMNIVTGTLRLACVYIATDASIICE